MAGEMVARLVEMMAGTMVALMELMTAPSTVIVKAGSMVVW